MSLEYPINKKEDQSVELNMDNVDKVVDSIEQIEGSAWRERQEQELLNEDEEPRNYTIRAAQLAVERFRQELDKFKEKLSKQENSEDVEWYEEKIRDYESGHGPKVEIYGAGGVNRYFVLSNGDIVISASHVGGFNKKDKLEKAKQLGIRSI